VRSPGRRLLWIRAALASTLLCLFGCSSERPTPQAVDTTAAESTDAAVDETEVEADGSLDGLWSLNIDDDLFVEGNLFFIGYHELAHALVSEFDLPVVGREEDAADRLAILLMTPEPGDSPDYLNAAMQGWFTEAAERPLESISWWDEHGTNEQRGFQIACLLFGANPDAFADVADAVQLPDDRRETCTYEAEQNQRSWATLLADHERADDAAIAQNVVRVEYSPTTEFGDQQQLLKDIGLLEHLQEFMTSSYTFDKGITVQADECGEANAFWNADDRTLLVCYELVKDFQTMA
jgi:hypothetical protein